MNRIVLPAEPLIDGPTGLRPWRDTDLPAIVRACQDPEIVRWTRVPERYGETDARSFLLARYDALLAGTTAPFAIVSAGDDDAAARLDLADAPRVAARPRRGRLLAGARRPRPGPRDPRGAADLPRGAFDTLGLERIDLLAGTGNAASQRVAERAGFTREAILRSYMRGKGERQDMVAFGLLRDEL